jgi:hypothetical protein
MKFKLIGAHVIDDFDRSAVDTNCTKLKPQSNKDSESWSHALTLLINIGTFQALV